MKFASATALEQLLNERDSAGWEPLFPMWDGEAIVFKYNPVFKFGDAIKSNEELAEEERLREP